MHKIPKFDKEKDNVYENTNPSKCLDQSGETRSQTKWDTESEGDYDYVDIFITTVYRS